MKDKKPPSGPILKRDANNKLDQDDVTRVSDQLIKKLITENRAYQKDISFNHARSGKRDVMVYVTMFIRNSVDGKIVLSDTRENGFSKLDDTGQDPYMYSELDFFEFPIQAREMPLHKNLLGKALLSLFNLVCQRLARIGAINGV